MVALELEIVLHRAFDAARKARHRFVTPEHLLLHLLDRKAVASHLEAKSVRVVHLRTALREHLAKASVFPPSDTEADTAPNLEFQNSIRRAALAARADGRAEVTVLDMLTILVDQKSALTVATLLRHAALPERPDGPPALQGPWCALCGSLTTPGLRTQVAGRGVLCPTCVEAVLATQQVRLTGR
jgi:ATP-dependent Clp protease ATP-binding subunit ClpA